jgi:hypothetical protein
MSQVKDANSQGKNCRGKEIVKLKKPLTIYRNKITTKGKKHKILCFLTRVKQQINS